ncbi:hypothetical protein BDF19DRAFT_482688 [Syncephalis fuscata]|nr:hypothetical protein BDF19DRAFT_482688 [Syncephalis fuscata]
MARYTLCSNAGSMRLCMLIVVAAVLLLSLLAADNLLVTARATGVIAPLTSRTDLPASLSLPSDGNDANNNNGSNNKNSNNNNSHDYIDQYISYDSSDNNSEDPKDPKGYISVPLYALVTQLASTSFIGMICFLLFCASRTRWPTLYAPKEIAHTITPISYLPKTFFGWISSVLRLRESQVLAVLGPDAVMFLRLWHLGARLFGILSACGILLIMPANLVASYYGANHSDASHVPLSMDIVPFNSPFLVLHMLFIYFFTAIACHYLHREYVAFVTLRRHFLVRTNPGVHTRTVMVTGLPSDLRTSDSVALRNFFEGLGVGKVQRACVMPMTAHLELALHERAQILRSLEKAYVKWINKRQRAEYRYQASRHQLSSGEASALIRSASTSSRPIIRTRFSDGDDSVSCFQWLTCGLLSCCCCGNSESMQGEMVDAIDHYTSKFNELDNHVRQLRRGSFEPSSTGFVTFKTQSSANIVAQTLNTDKPLSCLTSMAPEYRDINDSSRGYYRCYYLVFPCSMVTAVTNLESLYDIFPSIKPILELSPLIQGLVEGLIPTVAISIMVYFLRTTFEQLSMAEGHRTYSGIELYTMSKYFLFQMINVLLAKMITQSALDIINIIMDHPGSILEILGGSLPKLNNQVMFYQTAPFFINYTLLQGLVVLPATELLQISSIFTHLFHIVASWTPREHAEHDIPPAPKYGWLYPLPTLLFVVGLTFSITAPLILPATALFFFIGKLIFSYQFARVYQPKYEAGGRAWPFIFRRIIVGLLLFQLSTAGLLALKGSKIYSLLALPSIIMTLLFSNYCVRVYESQSSYLPLDVASGIARQEEVLYSNETDDEDDDKAGNIPEARPAFNSNNSNASITTTGWQPEARRGRSNIFGFNRRSESNILLPDAQDDNNDGNDADDAGEGTADSNGWGKRIKRVMSATTGGFPSMSSLRSNATQVVRRSETQTQPPMTHIDGVLDTELTQYTHLAVRGELPQPWPPAGLHIRYRGGVRSFFSL